MFETLVCTDLALARHRAGPLAEERNRYLRHCADQGGARESLRSKARAILRVAERMSPEDLGHVDASRLHEIACRSTSADTTAATTVATLVNCARPWLKYLDWWHEPVRLIPFASTLDEFVSWMRDERGRHRAPSTNGAARQQASCGGAATPTVTWRCCNRLTSTRTLSPSARNGGHVSRPATSPRCCVCSCGMRPVSEPAVPRWPTRYQGAGSTPWSRCRTR